MAGGMLTKQAEFLTARFLNDVNDAVLGGQLTSVPSTIPGSQGIATLPGDRIVLDDATALALSDTAVGTLYGGIYMYVGSLSSSTASPALGTLAFWPATNLPNGATPQYQVSSDANPTTALPNYIAGVFINAATKGNYCWIQVGGTASVKFDSALTATSSAAIVVAKVSAAIASTADAGLPGAATPTAAQIAQGMASVLGTAIGTPATSTVSPVILTRGLTCGRI